MNMTAAIEALTGKALAESTDQEIYLALLDIVREQSAEKVRPVTGRKLYYISAEFLIGKLLLAICNTPHMVTAGGGFIHDHAVAAHQPIDQRLDADGTKSDLAVADDDPCLHNVAGGYLRLQAGVHGLDVHTAFGDLAAFKADVRQPAENRKRHSGNVDIVDAAVAIAQVRTGGAVQGAQHTLAVFLLEPCVGVVGQQVGAFLPHTVIVGGGDAQMSADLPMGDAGDGHGLD